MIIFGDTRIIDVVVSGTYITKGIFIDDGLNEILVFSKSTTFISPTNFNIGDIADYAIIINNKLYTNITITSDNNDELTIKNNKVTFNKIGEYKLTLSYQTFKKTITVNVEDIIVDIS